VLNLRNDPIDFAYIDACDQTAAECPRTLRSGSDGFYEFTKLPTGKYRIKISAPGCYPVEIRDVTMGRSTDKTLPVIRLEVAPIEDCETVRRPGYYRLLDGVASGVGGLVTTDAGIPVAGSTVTLYVQDVGPAAKQKTKSDGSFSFHGLQPSGKECWASIVRDGFFREEQKFLPIIPGLEAVYAPIRLELCGPAHCQPHLKTIRVLPCAL